MNLRKYALQISAVAVLLLSALIIFLPSAKADGPGAPATPTDPYFREEVPPRMVECADNVFVPMGEGGTWECPPAVQEQLPSEVIGRQVDCPDGSVGRIINMDLETTCDEVDGAYPTVIPTPTATPTAEPTVEPLPDCTDPLVECACDHYIGGCTGGHPPEGEGTPFPTLVTPAEAAGMTPEPAESRISLEAGIAAGAALLAVAAGTLYMIYRKPKEG